MKRGAGREEEMARMEEVGKAKKGKDIFFGGGCMKLRKEGCQGGC